MKKERTEMLNMHDEGTEDALASRERDTAQHSTTQMGEGQRTRKCTHKRGCSVHDDWAKDLEQWTLEGHHTMPIRTVYSTGGMLTVLTVDINGYTRSDWLLVQ